MAGHSKWANIKHRKQIVDARKGVLFQTIVKQIKVAARENNNPETNFQLKKVIDKAKKLNCPNDLIKRALLSAQPDQEQTYWYEIKFAHLISVLIQITSSAKPAQILSEMRRLTNRYSAELLPSNSLLFEFKHQFVCETTPFSDDHLLALLEEINPQTVVNKATLTLFVLASRADVRLLKAFCKRHHLQIQTIKEEYQALQTVQVSAQIASQYQAFCQEMQTVFPTVKFSNNLTNRQE